MKKEKIGIYGGTFSPPHIGHVASVEAFASAIAFDRILIIPDYLPPHKEIDGGADAAQRLDMCKLAFSHINNAEISDMEIIRGGRSYTYKTLEELYGEGKELYFLLGTDMFLTLPEWKHPEKIFKLATICLVRREKDAKEKIDQKISEYREKYNAKIVLIESEVIEVSSTALRELLHNSLGSDLIPDAVLKYINEAGIYR